MTSRPTSGAKKSFKAATSSTLGSEASTVLQAATEPKVAEAGVKWNETARSTWRIISLVFRNKRARCKAGSIVVGLVLMLMLETLVTAWMSSLFSASTNALVYMDSEAFYTVLLQIAFACAIHLPLVCVIEALAGAFAIEWRRVVTKRLLELYISAKQAYYRMKSSSANIDNPDQRIGQDVAEFTVNVVKLLITIVGSSMKVVIMSGILISISFDLYIYMLLGSAVFTVVFLKLFGGQLMRLTRLVLSQEATFRFALIRVREHAESIAFFRGAPFELVRCTEFVEKALRTYYRRLSVWVVFSGGQKAVVTAAQFVPTLLLGPSVLRGETTVGTITQTNMLFGILLASLTSLVADLQTIASLGAQSVRIDQLRSVLESMDDDGAATGSATASIELREVPSACGDGDADGAGHCLQLDNVSLQPPLCEVPTVSGLSLELRVGESMLLCGESGVGKSSLLRAVGGLWAEGGGSISRVPAEDSFFLPQQPYLCLGTLRENIEYPKPPAPGAAADAEGSEAIISTLNQVGLAHLVERHGLDTAVDFESVLSGGEKQRLAFARLLLRPDVRFAILDEATSALDAPNEELVYSLLAERVPSFVSVGHRATLEKFHSHKLVLEKQPAAARPGSFGHFATLKVAGPGRDRNLLLHPLPVDAEHWTFMRQYAALTPNSALRAPA
eukprot:CAMPEP_0170308896 /NCGR_PEP_ID=MMETSP0116_2-20130129/54898_1 /TAXON_ID=400756 /ORGANISM="Durinskia baltica, Strain CSIRO CS-38" /LENGTH=673 /DNA_ID=CAMNT_0010561099 /DNA_START=41 /DNA_END=2060 /DNA_ORIENTATION=+